MRFRMWKKASVLACAALALLLPACQSGGNLSFFGYTTAPNYRCDIKTVRVKVFANRTYRQGLEFEMTNALIREIETHTPYKVVTGAADTEITGTILTFTKGLLNVNNVNEQRDVETLLGVQFTWRDLRSGEILSKPPRRPFETIIDAPGLALVQPVPQPEGMPGVPSPTIITAPTAPGIVAAANQSILVTTTTHFIPEIGQSLASSAQVNIDKLAREIRQLMETPW